MFGKKAYEAYREHTDGKSLATGSPIPEWDQLKPEIREAWDVATGAVACEVLRSFLHGWLDRAFDALTEGCEL